jgi:signal transduction histidine kinase
MRIAVGIKLALAALCTPMLCLSASAQALAPRTVLTIHEGAENFPANPLLEAGIRETLKSRPDLPIDYFAEYRESDDFPQEDASRAFADYIRRKYQNRRIDLVITTTTAGLDFTLDHRAELFPDAPIVFTTLDVPDDNERRVGAGAAGIRTGVNYLETLKLALALHPSTERVFFVTTRADQDVTEVIRAQVRGLASRVTVTFIHEETVTHLLEVIKHVPPRSLVVYQSFRQDTPGKRLYPDEVAPLVAGAAGVPVYGTNDIYLGSGVVGGVVRDTRESGTRLAAIALRILAGTRAQDIPIEDVPVVPILDWRALQRWGISESRLPPGSVIRFRGPNLWRDYRREVLAVLGALVVQSLLIIALLYQRGARQRAEVESRRNLALAADANRRVTMTALTGSIAHELGQPLNAILHNAKAAEMLVASKRATPETLCEILGDIRTANLRATQIIERHRTMLRNREFETRPIDIHAVVRESVALIAHDTTSRQIHVDVELPPDPCFVVGDPVLLQQVVVNLVMNAMDAMSETPPAQRRITVQNEVRSSNVEVSVRDAGTGLPASFDGKLFAPFVTTKTNGMGIGLTIARTIIEAHRGTIAAHNNPEGGATFTVMLPCAETLAIS